jgi:hypothetical protein
LVSWIEMVSAPPDGSMVEIFVAADLSPSPERGTSAVRERNRPASA